VTTSDSSATPDPMKGFRGVMAGTLVLEAIVVALALLVVAKLGGGVATWKGLVVGAMVLALVLNCLLLRFRWGLWVAMALQVVLIACFLVATAIGVIGVLFGLVWTYLWWLRRDVAKRMAEGRLPSQQPPPASDR
jgi:hypothetical protein